MSVTVQFDTDNAAFEDEDGNANTDEIGRILRKVAREVDRGILADSIRDVNGNTVGRFEVDTTSDHVDDEDGPSEIPSTWDHGEASLWFSNDEGLYHESRLIVEGNTASHGAQQLEDLWTEANPNPDVNPRAVDWFDIFAEIEEEVNGE